ncbi:MAG: hypothetical protein D3917_03590 [Candidatus Electrothrix sp. AX5]|nr:hypothetical protein [Candidatus Electrothrix sp. AX5]
MEKELKSTLVDRKQNSTAEKKTYEKPTLGIVSLFADQVLGNCRHPVIGTACVLQDSNMS